MLQNACSLAKIGTDAAENERHFAENLPKIGNYRTGPLRARPAAAAVGEQLLADREALLLAAAQDLGRLARYGMQLKVFEKLWQARLRLYHGRFS